jgi:hypothetical protein
MNNVPNLDSTSNSDLNPFEFSFFGVEQIFLIIYLDIFLLNSFSFLFFINHL